MAERDYLSQVNAAVDTDAKMPKCPTCGDTPSVRYEGDKSPFASCSCSPDPTLSKAPLPYTTPKGRKINHCADCDKYGMIASNTSGKELCKDCDVKSKATDAGMDAMRGSDNGSS